MFRIYVHSTVPNPYIQGHKGWWSWQVPDLTYIVAIAHDDHAQARWQAAMNPNIIHVAPTRISGLAVPSTMQTAVNNLTTSINPTASTTSSLTSMTTTMMLDQIFNASGDVAFHREASL